jgi:putative transposase
VTIQENLSSGLSLSISQSCQALQVSRRGYYKWRTQPEIASTASEDMDLKNQFQEVALEFPSFGYRRITVLNSRTAVMQLTANAR